MKHVAPLLTLALFIPACGSFATQERTIRTPETAHEVTKPTATADDSPPVDSRQVGDFTVHRFSGSYEKAPWAFS